ncbi:transposase [Treponema sp. OMZ 840]
MCGIGQYTRRPVVHVSSNCSSAAGKTALQKIRQRFIGTLQTECPDYHCEPMNVHELQESIDEWIFKYENQRPHEGLDFLTPKQFEAMFYTQKNSLVSYFQ